MRHGESVANVAATRAEADGRETIDIDIRDADVPLSASGREQARALGEWLRMAAAEIDRYYVSPYARARETLSIALADAGPTERPVFDERLRDRELGTLDLLTTLGVAERHPQEAERRRHLGKFYHRPPGGESWADVALRLRSFFADTAVSEGTTMIVAHDAVVMLILYVLLPLDEAELLDFASNHTVLNASLTCLERHEDAWKLVDFASVTHLERADAPVTAHPGSPDVEPE